MQSLATQCTRCSMQVESASVLGGHERIWKPFAQCRRRAFLYSKGLSSLESIVRRAFCKSATVHYFNLFFFRYSTLLFSTLTLASESNGLKGAKIHEGSMIRKFWEVEGFLREVRISSEDGRNRWLRISKNPCEFVNDNIDSGKHVKQRIKGSKDPRIKGLRS